MKNIWYITYVAAKVRHYEEKASKLQQYFNRAKKKSEAQDNKEYKVEKISNSII